MVTTTWPPGATDVESKLRVALGVGVLGASTVTLVAPPTVWSSRSKSLSVPEKLWEPAVLEAVTV